MGNHEISSPALDRVEGDDRLVTTKTHLASLISLCFPNILATLADTDTNPVDFLKKLCFEDNKIGVVGTTTTRKIRHNLDKNSSILLSFFL